LARFGDAVSGVLTCTGRGIRRRASIVACSHPMPQTNMHKDEKVEDYTSLFDGEAVDAAKMWDKQIAAGCFVRGEMFLNAVKSSVRPGGYVLDYGCGPGRISTLLARNGFRVLGRDPSPGMIAMAEQQSLEGLAVEFQPCSFIPTELPPETYDGIVCSSVIEYAPDPAEFLRTLHPAIRPNGVLIISFANRLSLFRAWHRLVSRNKDHYLTARKHTWSWWQFRDLLDRNGFASDAPQYFFSFFDEAGPLRSLSASRIWGGLGLAIARKR
jgi:2-polyprenyl-6-hydroxyphenyl methylase/3-demethylubiquinone-9 3-methyltransferase